MQVQQVAWHPNGLVLATACTDFKCRVVSAVLAEVRARHVPRNEALFSLGIHFLTRQLHVSPSPTPRQTGSCVMLL